MKKKKKESDATHLQEKKSDKKAKPVNSQDEPMPKVDKGKRIIKSQTSSCLQGRVLEAQQ